MGPAHHSDCLVEALPHCSVLCRLEAGIGLHLYLTPTAWPSQGFGHSRCLVNYCQIETESKDIHSSERHVPESQSGQLSLPVQGCLWCCPQGQSTTNLWPAHVPQALQSVTLHEPRTQSLMQPANNFPSFIFINLTGKLDFIQDYAENQMLELGSGFLDKHIAIICIYPWNAVRGGTWQLSRRKKNSVKATFQASHSCSWPEGSEYSQVFCGPHFRPAPSLLAPLTLSASLAGNLTASRKNSTLSSLPQFPCLDGVPSSEFPPCPVLTHVLSVIKQCYDCLACLVPPEQLRSSLRWGMESCSLWPRTGEDSC